MDDALAGTRVLIAGGDGDAARALGARLAAGAAQVTVAPDADAAAQAALAGRPDVIVALGAAEAELRELLDPLDLRTGPPLVPAADLDRPEDDENRATVRRLRSLRRPSAAAGTSTRCASRPCGGSRSLRSTATTTHAEAGARVLADAES